VAESARFAEALVDARMRARFGRKDLLEMSVPPSWTDQYELFGLA
jgi:hypothetical protein